MERSRGSAAAAVPAAAGTAAAAAQVQRPGHPPAGREISPQAAPRPIFIIPSPFTQDRDPTCRLTAAHPCGTP